MYLELTLLKSVNQWLIENGKLPAEAKITYSLSKPVGTDTYCYSRSEVGAMIKHCESTSGLEWLAHVIIALAHLGVRIGELAGLRWSDVDLHNNVITVADERASRRKRLAGTMRTTKGKRSRKIPIHPRLRGSGDHHTRDGRAGLSRRARRPTPSPERADGVHSRRDRTARREVPDTGWGDRLRTRQGAQLQALFCQSSLPGGASEGEIREWVGHADSKMVEHYRHLGRKDAVRRMEQISFVDPDADEQERSGQDNNACSFFKPRRLRRAGQWWDSVMKMIGQNRSAAGATAVSTTAAGGLKGRVCPSVCPSDWDKRKTPFASPC